MNIMQKIKYLQVIKLSQVHSNSSFYLFVWLIWKELATPYLKSNISLYLKPNITRLTSLNFTFIYLFHLFMTTKSDLPDNVDEDLNIPSFSLYFRKSKGKNSYNRNTEKTKKICVKNIPEPKDKFLIIQCIPQSKWK